jgi:hypothetical protein
MMFKGFKEKISLSHDNVSTKKRKTLKSLKHYFMGGGNYSLIFAFRGGLGN